MLAFLAAGAGRLSAQGPPAALPATVVIRLPASGAVVVQGQRMPGSGVLQRFRSPPLAVGKRYVYHVRATWKEGGQVRSAERRVRVAAGARVSVDFRTAAHVAAGGGGATGSPASGGAGPSVAARQPSSEGTTAAGGTSAERQTLIELTNRERAKAGLPALVQHARLMQAAQAHAANMARQQTLNHTLDGREFWQRIEATGYRSGAAAENIAMGASTPSGAVAMWMQSPGHRGNILGRAYSQIGVGIAKGSNGRKYYCQVFASPAGG